MYRWCTFYASARPGWLRKTSVKVQYTYIPKNTHTLQNPHKHTHYKTHSYTHVHTHTTKHNKSTVQIKTKCI
jgi:hypothetical protein